jgi:hypothetical protein
MMRKFRPEITLDGRTWFPIGEPKKSELAAWEMIHRYIESVNNNATGRVTIQ